MNEDRPVYGIEREIEQDLGSGSERVRLHDSVGGSVFQCYTYAHPALREPFEKCVGWTYELGVTFAPDPERLAGFMEKFEVPIKFVDKRGPIFGNIPPETYGATVLEGFHPISVNNKFHYLHDISSDHLPAVMVGGKAVIDTIATNQSGSWSNMVSLAHRYDMVTEILSASLTQTLSAKMKGRDVVAGFKLNTTNRDAIIRIWGSGGLAACAELERVLKEGLERLGLL